MERGAEDGSRGERREGTELLSVQSSRGRVEGFSPRIQLYVFPDSNKAVVDWSASQDGRFLKVSPLRLEQVPSLHPASMPAAQPASSALGTYSLHAKSVGRG